MVYTENPTFLIFFRRLGEGRSLSAPRRQGGTPSPEGNARSFLRGLGIVITGWLTGDDRVSLGTIAGFARLVKGYTHFYLNAKFCLTGGGEGCTMAVMLVMSQQS